MARQAKSSAEITERVAIRENAVIAAKRVLNNLYSLVTQGLVDVSDNDFKERFSKAKHEVKVAEKERDQVSAELAPKARVDLEAVATFVSDMTEALDLPSASAKRAYLRSVIDGIEVGEKIIRIHGRRSQIEHAVVHGGVSPSAVPTFVREWRRGWA